MQTNRRTFKRYPVETEYAVEFKIPSYPVYQLKVQDVSVSGVGVIVRSDSNFLTLIQIGQQLQVKLLAPRDSVVPQGIYQVRIAHISESQAGRFKGHMVVGIELLQKIAEY